MQQFGENVAMTLKVHHNGSNEGIRWYMLTRAFLENLYNVNNSCPSGENTFNNDSNQSVHTYW